MMNRSFTLASASALLLLLGAADPSRSQDGSRPVAPVLAPAADPMAKADPDMARVIAVWQVLAPKAIETLEPAEARRQPNLADAQAKMIKHDKLDIQPRAGLDVSDSHYADMGNLHLRFYVPKDVPKETKLPIVLYFRGGGWVLSDLDDYDASASALARQTNAVVISVDYPSAPTDRFPTAHDDAVGAFKYVLKNAEAWGYDPRKVALAGEGAGGNLALNVALAARDQNLTKPVSAILVGPIATTEMDTPSKREDATAKPLNTAVLAWLWSYVLRDEADRRDPRLNLVAADLSALPPVTIINAEIDPLRSDGNLLADRLREAGVETTLKLFSGVTHDFFGLGAVVAKAREAQAFAAAQIRRGFEADAK